MLPPKSIGALFSGVIAILLLLLYAVTMYYIIEVATCSVDHKCAITDPRKVTDGMIYVLTTVGGLVSALVVSQLAITTPGDNPAKNFIPTSDSPNLTFAVNIIGASYLLIWIITGFSALVFGVMLYPGASAVLGDAGTTWLGVAVAAGYSYFGINPKRNGE